MKLLQHPSQISAEKAKEKGYFVNWCGVGETGDPTAGKTPSSDDKVTICHATGSASNPYVEITISKSAVQAHAKHAGDIIPAPSTGCPMTLSAPSPAK
jgi:hypothetical protein